MFEDAIYPILIDSASKNFELADLVLIGRMCKGSEESWPKRCPPRRCQLVFTWNQGLFRCWLLACNAPNELPERIGVGYAEIHAMAMLQGPGQLRRRCGGSKDRWDDRTFPIYELA